MQYQLIVFSKDRAPQLDLCLQSINKNAQTLFDDVTVIAKATDDEYRSGYHKCQKYHPQFNIKEQTGSFYDDVMNTIDRSKYDFVCFMTDDDILYSSMCDVHKRVISEMMMNMIDVACFSLRLGKNTIIQDPFNNTLTMFPRELTLFKGALLWNWTTIPGNFNFGYPLSVDGHIFSIEEIECLLSMITFDNPNHMEGVMQTKTDCLGVHMGCFEKSKLINTPVNRVQNAAANRAGEIYGLDIHYANCKFLAKYRLSLDKMDFSNVEGCHQEIELKWM